MAIFFTNKYIFNTNIIKKEVKSVTNRALGILGRLCALGISAGRYTGSYRIPVFILLML